MRKKERIFRIKKEENLEKEELITAEKIASAMDQIDEHLQSHCATHQTKLNHGKCPECEKTIN